MPTTGQVNNSLHSVCVLHDLLLKRGSTGPLSANGDEMVVCIQETKLVTMYAHTSMLMPMSLMQCTCATWSRISSSLPPGCACISKTGCRAHFLLLCQQRDVQMEESEASTSQCLVPSPFRPGQEVPPQVSRRVLEYANHLARNRSEVARDMLRLRVPTPDQLARHTAALQVDS